MINASIREMLRTQSVSFTTAAEPTPQLAKAARQAGADYAAGKHIVRTKNKGELQDYLDSL